MREMSKIFSGWAQGGEGRASDGLSQIRQAITAYQKMGGAAFGVYYLGLLAETHGKTGQAEEGLATVDQALAEVQRTGGRYYEAELYRLKGQLALQQQCRVQSAECPVPSTQHLAPKPKPKRVFSKLSRLRGARGQKCWNYGL
jgi:predicted ATPase